MVAVDVSVVIVSWNTRELLRDCLASIFGQTGDIAFEVIVVDNDSADGSAAMVHEGFPSVIVIENTENRGFAAANNEGMAVARGRYVLLLNPDTIVLDGAIQKTVRIAERTPNVAVLGCQVRLNEHEIQQTCFRFPSVPRILALWTGLRRAFPRTPALGWVDYQGWDRRSARDVDVVSGMYMLVRRAAVDEVGVMDDGYFVYAEETDWCFRFRAAGWRRVFTPEACIIHRDGGGHSASIASVRMFVQLQKSLLRFFRRQRGVMPWVAVRLIFATAMLARSLYYGVRASRDHTDLVTKKAAQSRAALIFHLLGTGPR